MPHDRATIEAVYALYGDESASVVGARFGLTRNAVIGLWTRERIRCGDPPKRVTASHEKRAAEGRAMPRPIRKQKQAREAKVNHAESRPHGALFFGAARFREPPKPTELPLEAPAVSAVEFLARRPSQCAWPLWSDPAPDVRELMCCGAPQRPGSSYCAHHFGLSRRQARVNDPDEAEAIGPADGETPIPEPEDEMEAA